MTSSPSETEFLSSAGRPEEADVDLLFIPVFQGEDLADVAGVNEATGGEWRRALAAREFRAAPYEVFLAPVTGTGWRARRIGFVGAGAHGEATSERTRRIAAASGFAARHAGAATCGWLVRGGLSATAVTDGLSASEFDGGIYKRAEEHARRYPHRITILEPGADVERLAACVVRGRVIGEWANFARGLANEPANVLTPQELAVRISAAAARVGLAVDVLDESRLRALGMRLLLSVAQGSAEAPRCIVLRYEPAGAAAAPVLGFVGKGVTFDTGGISIKPAEGMGEMKKDMTGGATVAAAICALAVMRAPVRVIAVIPAVENMVGGRAMRPGDVVAGASGKTVEITNTDAEGRLILADALWYARQLGATHLVDVATLTGAAKMALGRYVSALCGQPAPWVQDVQEAGARAGDRLSALPIYEEARDELRSEIADLVNQVTGPGGAITAAAFLREFAGDAPWAHLDIAGTAWSDAKRPYQPKGPTGVAVRTLIELAESISRSPAG